MALDALRCNHLAPLGFKGLTRSAMKGLTWTRMITMFNIITGEKEERKAEEHKARDEVQARQTADGAGAQVITLLTGKLLTQQSTGVPDKTGRRCHVRHDDITVIMEDEKY